jgi:hypothetical protein
MLVIPAHGRLREEDCEFKVSLVYIVRPCLKTKSRNSNLRKISKIKEIDAFQGNLG